MRTEDGRYIATCAVTVAQAEDLDMSGDVDIADVTAILNILAESGTPESAFDLDGNGNVSILDVTVLLNFLAGNEA